MRLAWKLSLVLLPAVSVVLAAFAFVRVQREVALFHEDTRRDQRIVATTLAHAAEAVWARQGPEPALAMIRDSDAARSGVSIRWVSLDKGQGSPELKPLLPPSELEMLGSEGLIQKVWTPPAERSWDDAAESLTTYALASHNGRVLGAIEVTESLASAEDYLNDTLRNTALLTLSLALCCVLVMWAIGVRFITRPVALLVRRARELGTGGSGPPLGLTQRDELGDLARALDEAAQELEQAKQRAAHEAVARLSAQEQLRHAERLATTGRLASALAHEIGTPLNVASGHAQLIEMRQLGEDQTVESARRIRSQCDRIANLVRQLLDFARRQPPKPELVPLADLMRVTVDLLGPLAKRKEVTLALEANDEGVAVVDAFQAQQALTNIVMNAVQASPAGGQVHVTLDRQELRHAERAEAAPADYVRISVSDSGPGVPKNQTEQIFEPFFTTKISGEGTGLGLSIARDIVREHGGWIAVSSYQGATFELYWPTRSSAEREQPSVERPSALPVC